MAVDSPHRQTSRDSRGLLLYDRVREQLDHLISRFALQAHETLLGQAFELLSREALAIPAGAGGPGYFSTLNEDGTPFQLALALHRADASVELQFLGEVGGFNLSNQERQDLALETVSALSRLFGCENEWRANRAVVERFAPRDNLELSTDTGSAFWLGVSCRPREAPRLLLYANAHYGSDRAPWSRLAEWASHLGARDRWESQQPLLREKMRPLGVSLSLQAGRPPAGRIYVRGYGNPLNYYQHLAAAAIGTPFAELLETSAYALLGAECAYPMRSVVCSYAFAKDRHLDFKTELCAHCLFNTDTEATTRCRDWLHRLGMPVGPYLAFLRNLIGDPPPATARGLHSFVGLGSDAHRAYCTLYFNPGAAANLWSLPR